ncbi:MAG TPA: hypothetical protein VGH33_08635 [Isosphaeraceae bacterium]
MRISVAALLVGATACLSGCGSTTAPDPYDNMRMLTTEELGVSIRNQDPVELAEKAQNAQFARGRKTP